VVCCPGRAAAERADADARSADADISTRAACEAAGVTAPTLYHHFGDKERLLAGVVDFGWAAFLESKRATAAVVHAHVADDIRAGWDNHFEFARENPNFYKLMWSPAVSANSAAFREAFQMLCDRLELGASRGQLRASVETGARMIMPAVTGAALSVISQPDLFGDPTFTTQLREAVIAAVTVTADRPTGKRSTHDARTPTIATAAATLKSKLAIENTSLTAPERALMDQWLTTLADAPTAALATPRRRPQRKRGSRPKRRPGARRRRSSGAPFVEVLQELVCCELDLLVPPLRGPVVAGDQPHAVQTAEVAVDKRVARLRLLGRALGKAEMPGGVLLPGVRLQERVLLPCPRLDVLPT
jgi:AcrR family transcriptional regulator